PARCLYRFLHCLPGRIVFRRASPVMQIRMFWGPPIIFWKNTHPLFKSSAKTQVSDRFSHSRENFASASRTPDREELVEPSSRSSPRLNARSDTGEEWLFPGS